MRSAKPEECLFLNSQQRKVYLAFAKEVTRNVGDPQPSHKKPSTSLYGCRVGPEGAREPAQEKRIRQNLRLLPLTHGRDACRAFLYEHKNPADRYRFVEFSFMFIIMICWWGVLIVLL